MFKIKKKIPQSILIFNNSKGQTLVEYGLLLILIAVVVIAAVTIVGQKTNNMFSTIGTSFPSPP